MRRSRLLDTALAAAVLTCAGGLTVLQEAPEAAARVSVWTTTSADPSAPAPQPPAPEPPAPKASTPKPPAAKPPAAPKPPAAKPPAAKPPAAPKPPAAKPAAAKPPARPGASAAALRASGCDGRPGWRERRAARAVAAVGMSPADLGYSLQVAPARPGLLGVTTRSARRVVLHVRDCRAQSDADLAWVLAHETAHALDFVCDDVDRRQAWLAARAPGTRTYWPRPGARDDLSSGAGDFAEVFALARTGHRPMWASRLAPAPDRAALARLAPLLVPRC